MKKTRKSNLELLRIISMVFIVAFHAIYKSGLMIAVAPIQNRIIYDVIFQLSNAFVTCFILTSGYFMSKTKFSIKKIILIILQVEFYILLVAFYNRIMFKTPIMPSQILFPIVKEQYWFISVYVYLMILTPLLKWIAEKMNRIIYAILLCALTLVLSVYPTIVLTQKNGIMDTEAMPYYHRLMWAVVVFLLGDYIARFGLLIINTKVKALVAMIGYFAINVFYMILCEIGKINPFGGNMYVSYQFNNFRIFLFAITVFCTFLYAKEFSSKIVNYVASCTLGIYLLHDGGFQVVIWYKVFHLAQNAGTNMFLPYLLYAVAVIFVAGIVLETIRKQLEKPVIWILRKIK